MRIAYFVMRYPSATQTFIEREMFALAAQGIEIEVRPIWDFRSADQVRVELPPGMSIVRSGGRWRVAGSMVIGTLRELSRRPALAARGLRLLLVNLPRFAEGWFMTVWGTFTALSLAQEFRQGGRTPDVFHGTWATAPATAAAVLSELCGRPFSFGAHAYDVHRHGGDPLLGPKLRAASFVHTTTEANVDHLDGRFPGHRAKIVLARRGLGPDALRRADEIATGRSPRSESGEFRLLSVGRLVEKKGQVHQLEACAELIRRGRSVRLRVVGEGPLRGELERRISAAGLAGRVTLDGERTGNDVWAAYAWADAFWHTGVVDSQGDRDGLPNVVPEAMACALPVISTAAGGAAEAIMDGQSGLIVADPSDTTVLADAVERLMSDPTLCRRLGSAARVWVQENFQAAANIRRLADAFAAGKDSVNDPSKGQ